MTLERAGLKSFLSSAKEVVFKIEAFLSGGFFSDDTLKFVFDTSLESGAALVVF